MANEITNNGFAPQQQEQPHVNTPEDLAGIFSDFINQSNDMSTHGGDMSKEDIDNFWDNLVTNSDANKTAQGGATDARTAYFDAIKQQAKARTAAEKEHWANIAAQYQAEMMRDSDRAYNSATSQVERLMAAGMSRQAAMAAVQGVASEGQVAGVQNAAPTKGQEFLNKAEQVGQIATSLASAASVGVGLAQCIKLFPFAMKTAKSQADVADITAWYAKREQEGTIAADAMIQAAFDSYARLLEKHETDPENYPEPPNMNPHSVKEIKDMIDLAASKGISQAAITYKDVWQELLEGNAFGQARVQRAFTGWAGEGKAYHPNESAWQYLDNQVKYGAMTTQQNYFNACTAGRKMQSEIELNGEECKTAGHLRSKLDAETGLAITRRQGEEIANKLAELDYEVRTDYTAYECAYYSGQTEILLSSYDQGFKSAEAERIAGDAQYQAWVASQRYQYILDPQGYQLSHQNDPWTLRLVEDAAGTLDAMTNYYNMQSAEGASEVSQYTGEHAAGVVGLGMINDNLRAIGTLFGGYGVASGRYQVGMPTSSQSGVSVGGRVHQPQRRVNLGHGSTDPYDAQ